MWYAWSDAPLWPALERLDVFKPRVAARTILPPLRPSRVKTEMRHLCGDRGDVHGISEDGEPRLEIGARAVQAASSSAIASSKSTDAARGLRPARVTACCSPERSAA